MRVKIFIKYLDKFLNIKMGFTEAFNTTLKFFVHNIVF